LKQVSGTITCDFTIPTSGQALDYGQVNVETLVGGSGMPTFVGKVDGAAQCTDVGGWYYDANPPATPSRITLCPKSCDPVKAAPGSTLRVVIGCASMPPPIR
jgi:hypothetical protein